MTTASAPTLTVTPLKTATYRIAVMPRNASAVKTIQRLMRLQPQIQRGLTKLSKRRQRDLNDVHQRGGRMWTSRIKVTKLVTPQVGATFKVRVTPQIVPDITSVAKYLEAVV